METGLAANIEIFADGETIFIHNANFVECDPNATAEEIVTKLYGDDIMAKIDELQEQGSEVVYQLSLATSDGVVFADGVAGDLIPEDTADFATELYAGLPDLHKQMVEQQLISNDCTYASQDTVQTASMAIKPM